MEDLVDACSPGEVVTIVGIVKVISYFTFFFMPLTIIKRRFVVLIFETVGSCERSKPKSFKG